MDLCPALRRCSLNCADESELGKVFKLKTARDFTLIVILISIVFSCY